MIIYDDYLFNYYIFQSSNFGRIHTLESQWAIKTGNRMRIVISVAYDIQIFVGIKSKTDSQMVPNIVYQF